MPHFFIPPGNIISNRFILDGDEAYHLIRVKRCQPGDEIELFDGTGKIYTAKIDSILKNSINGTIIGEQQAASIATDITLYNAVPKGDRFDWLVEKAAELGIKRIVPLITERSVLRDISELKIERWKRLSQAASKQCGRTDIMSIGQPAELFEAIIKLETGSLNLIPWESEGAKSIKDALAGKNRRINIFIGPEGGFTVKEIEQAKNSKLIPVSLGPRILRAETAGLVASVIMMQFTGEFDPPQKSK